MRSAVLALFTLVVALVASQPAGAKTLPSAPVVVDPQSSDNLDPVILSIMRRQEALNPAVTVLTQESIREPGSGFSGIAFEGDGLSLYWKGPVTAGMATALVAARKIGPVRLKPARYSKAELVAAAARIEAAGENRSDIQAIALKTDGSGLRVDKMPAWTAAGRAARTGRPILAAEDAIAAAHTRVPVEVTRLAKPVHPMGCPSTGCNRLDDTAEWNSGDYMRTDLLTQGKVGHCTTGFGVHDASGRSYILTAGHCLSWQSAGGDDAEDYYGWEYMGRATWTEDWDKDLILVDGPGWYWMFDGSPTTSYHKTVHSWGYFAYGEYLCQSGSTSGTVCGLVSGDMNYSYCACPDSDGDYYDMHGLATANQVDGKVAARGGDSGAPVFSLDGDGVRAKGVLSGGNDGSFLIYQDMADVTTDRSGPGSSSWNAVWPLTN